MKPGGQRFRVLPATYAVCQLPAGASVPAWVTGEFVNVTSTADEVSVICPSQRVPTDVKAEGGWRVLKIEGPFPFAAVGVLASFAGPLAQAGVSLLTVATYDTDYLLVKDANLQAAVEVLAAAGHRLEIR